MSENSGLSVYNYLSETEGHKLIDKLATRIHTGMENPDPDFQRQKAKMIEVTSSGRIRRGMLVYVYRVFRNNLVDKFFGDIGDDCFVDSSGVDESERRRFFDELVKQILESERDPSSNLLFDLAFKKVLKEELEYTWEVFEAAFSDLRVINMTEDVKGEVGDVVEE